MPTTRINNNTRETLKLLALKTGQSMIDILDQSVEYYKRKIFIEECNKAYAALKTDKEAWQEELEERTLSDNTINDDLEEDFI